MESYVCHNCGNVLNPSVKFCGKCGTKVNFEPQSVIQSTSSEMIIPPLFYELNEFFWPSTASSTNKFLAPNILQTLLNDFEKRNREAYERAKEMLLDAKPVEAIDSLWKMKNKFMFPEEKKGDLYYLLGEIGGEKVVRLIVDNNKYTDNEYSLIALSKIRSNAKIPWLSEYTNFVQFPFDILAIKNLEQTNSPEVISILINQSSFMYIEEEIYEPSGTDRNLLSEVLLRKKQPKKSTTSSLLSIGIASVANYNENKNKKLALTGLITAPYVKTDNAIEDSTNLLKTYLTEMYRLGAVLKLCGPNGVRKLDNMWSKDDARKLNSVDVFLSGCYLYMGAVHPKTNAILDSLMSKNPDAYSVHLSLIYLMDALLRGKSNLAISQYLNFLRSLMRHKHQIIREAISASILYNNFSPLKEELFPMTLTEGMIPALVFSSIEHDNHHAKSLLSSTTWGPEIEYYKTYFEKIPKNDPRINLPQ